MSVKLAIRPGDLKRITEKRLTPDLYAAPVEDLVRDASEFVLHEAQDGAADLGGIASSLGADVTPMSAKITSSHPGALTAEFGRRAGSRMPPPDEMARYGEETFAIARAVSERGYKGRFFMTKARQALQRSEFPRLIEHAKSQIAARWRT